MKPRLAVAAIILAALLLSSAPYLIGYCSQPAGLHFMGLTHNLDDATVYLSWMRQTADGAFFIRNQFTVEQQDHLQFNLLFLIMGWVSRVLNAPLVAVYHAARLIFGAGLMLMIYHFAGLFLQQRDQRICVLLVAGFSSGLGWLFKEGFGRTVPVDMWQPEAITFLSLYLNPLFLCAQILILASFLFLMRTRATGRTLDAIVAGFLLLLLANIHTYDIVTVAVVWLAFLIADSAVRKKIDKRVIVLSALAGVIASPALLYQLFLYCSEEVFRLRANTPALSPPLWAYLAGFGLIAALAALGLVTALKRRGNLLLPVVWATVGFAIPYLPLAQQRKLLMGIHIPLAILAVLAIVWMTDKRKWPLGLAALVVTLAAFPSNLLFMAKDVGLVRDNRTATLCRPSLTDAELAGMRWLRANTDRYRAVLISPDIACFLPALSGNRVYLGHWSETPNYYDKLREYRYIVDAGTSDFVRMQLLANAHVDYLWWDTDLRGVPSATPDTRQFDAFDPEGSYYLVKVFQEGSVRIYRVLLTDHRRIE